MYHALAIGLADNLLVDLQNFFCERQLQFTVAITLHSATRFLAETVFHLLIIDIEYLRKIRQIHWLSSLRRSSFAPVIVLSDTPEVDLIIAVDLGADICISKQWLHTNIATLAHAQLRRYTEYNYHDDPGYNGTAAFQKGDILIDPARHTVDVQGRSVKLRPREFSLLLYLMRNSNVVLSAEKICDQAWGIEGIYKNGIAQPIRLLRVAIEPNPGKPIYIHTVRGVGYCFVPNTVETCDFC